MSFRNHIIFYKIPCLDSPVRLRLFLEEESQQFRKPAFALHTNSFVSDLQRDILFSPKLPPPVASANFDDSKKAAGAEFILEWLPKNYETINRDTKTSLIYSLFCKIRKIDRYSASRISQAQL